MMFAIILFFYLSVVFGMLLHEYLEDEKITKDNIKLSFAWPWALMCQVPIVLFVIRAIMPIQPFYQGATLISIAPKKQNAFKKYFDENTNLFEKQSVNLNEKTHQIVFIIDSKTAKMPSKYKWIPMSIFYKMIEQKGEKIFLEENNPDLYYYVWKISENILVTKQV